MSRCDNIKFVSIQFLLFGGGSIFPPPIASVDYPPPLIPHPVCLSQPQSLCLGRGVAFRTIGEGSVRSPPPRGGTRGIFVRVTHRDVGGTEKNGGPQGRWPGNGVSRAGQP